MEVKELLSTMDIDQELLIYNQHNDETYEGTVKDLDKNDFAETIKNAKIFKLYTNLVRSNTIIIRSIEEE